MWTAAWPWKGNPFLGIAAAGAFTELEGFPFHWGDTRLLIAHGVYLILNWHGRHIFRAKNKKRLSQVTYKVLREITTRFINVHRKR